MIKKYIKYILLFIIYIMWSNSTYASDLDGYRFTLSGSSLVVSDYSNNIIDTEPTALTLENFQILKYNNYYYIALRGYYYPSSIRYKHTFIIFNGTTLTEIETGNYAQNSTVVDDLCRYSIDINYIYYGCSVYVSGNSFFYTLIINKNTGVGSEYGSVDYNHSPYVEYNVNPNIPLYYNNGAITTVEGNYIFGTLARVQNGYDITGISGLINHNINSITLYQYNSGTTDLVDSYTYNPGLSYTANTVYSLQLRSSSNFTFSPYFEYEIAVTFCATVCEEHVYIDENGSYSYNPANVDPSSLTYNFALSRVEYFENGFGLRNFTANPSGGVLYFDIIQPNASGSGTTTIQTQDYYNYGLDTFINVTLPYHPRAGQYSMRPVYVYRGYTVYPFGTDYNSYVITLGESYASINEDFVSTMECDINNDGFVDTLTELPTCGYNKSTEALNGFLKLIKRLMNIGNVEYNPMSWIIEDTYASSPVDGIHMPDNNHIFMKVYTFIKYGLYLICVILILLMIVLNRKK